MGHHYSCWCRNHRWRNLLTITEKKRRTSSRRQSNEWQSEKRKTSTKCKCQGHKTAISDRRGAIAEATLPDLYKNIERLEPAPGSVELLTYISENRDLIGALIGPGGDQAFIKKVIDMSCSEVSDRMQTGILPAAVGAFFDYYLASVVSAEVGVVQLWFERDLAESPETMARIMTVIAFVRPGDLYGMPIDVKVPAYGAKLMGLNIDIPAIDFNDITSGSTGRND